MNYAWPVVFSALFGAGVGASFAYSNAEFFVSRARSAILLGVILISIPFTIYFSIDKNPILTPFFYFLPVFGVVFYYVSTLIIEQQVGLEAKNTWDLMEEARREEQLADIEEKKDRRDEAKDRREKARRYRKHVEPIDEMDLDERIKRMRDKDF